MAGLTGMIHVKDSLLPRGKPPFVWFFFFDFLGIKKQGRISSPIKKTTDVGKMITAQVKVLQWKSFGLL